MWSESQRVDLARISESDRQAAMQAARRYTQPRYRDMLDAGDDDSDWEYAALLALFLFRGRRVTPVAVRAQLARVLAGLEKETAAMTQSMSAVGPWALGMTDIVKASALVGTAFAVGGWAQLTAPAIADVEAGVLSELGYLDNFADEIAAGSVRRDGRYVRRAMLYAAAGWGVYQVARGRAATTRGYQEEHNVLDPGAEHCAGCVAETAQEWQPIGTLVPVGDRQCRSHCRCYLIYRNAAGEVFE